MLLYLTMVVIRPADQYNLIAVLPAVIHSLQLLIVSFMLVTVCVSVIRVNSGSKLVHVVWLDGSLQVQQRQKIS